MLSTISSKPFDDTRFERALDRAKHRVTQSRQAVRKPLGLVVKRAGSILFVNFSEIDWIEAADYYSRLHVGQRTQLLRRSMSELESELDDVVFCRIHRSTIVKLDRMRCLELNESGEYDVRLDDGTSLRLSRRYRRQLQARLNVRGSSD